MEDLARGEVARRKGDHSGRYRFYGEYRGASGRSSPIVSLNFASVVGRENVIAGVDCGFAEPSQAVFKLTPRSVWLKLQSLAEGYPRLASGYCYGRRGRKLRLAGRCPPLEVLSLLDRCIGQLGGADALVSAAFCTCFRALGSAVRSADAVLPSPLNLRHSELALEIIDDRLKVACRAPPPSVRLIYGLARCRQFDHTDPASYAARGSCSAGDRKTARPLPVCNLVVGTRDRKCPISRSERPFIVVCDNLPMLQRRRRRDEPRLVG